MAGPECIIDGERFPVAVDPQEGILFKVSDTGREIREEWSDWSGGFGET